MYPRMFIRQRWVLGAILCSSIIYFSYHMLHKPRTNVLKDRNPLQVQETDIIDVENILRRLKWHSPFTAQANTSKTDKVLRTETYQMCKNSVQGQEFIADDRGFVCKRDSIKPGGCCDIRGFYTNRYMCDTCTRNNCCMIYEHCVSCCMQPDNRQLLEMVIRSAVDSLQKLVFASVYSQFELCLSNCRTSSNSVQHENTYRDAKQKYCFGISPPELHLGEA